MVLINRDARYFGAVQRHFAVEGLDLTELGYAPRTHIPLHSCPGFFMAIDGVFVEGWGTKTQRLEPGDVSYHPAGEGYWLSSCSVRARGFAVDVSDAWCRMHGVEVGWDDAPRNLSQNRVSWLMARLFVELGVHDTVRPLAAKALSLEICAELTAARTRSERHRPPWLAKVLELLRGKATEGVTLSDLSSAAGVSPVSVIKAFRRHEGMTPGEFMRSVRLVEARRSLAATTRPLAVIASQAGFYDKSHFSHALRAAVGTSPGAYRQLLRGASGTAVKAERPM
jgi:AraC family transcriptional regulator